MSVKKLAGVLFIAAVMAVFIRMFVFETIRITTSAMSENQTAGNRLIVEKWSVGARLPLSIGIPFASDDLYRKKTYFRITDFPFRIPGLKKIKRNDLLAFNYPVEDDKPIDMHPILLSRCVGLPGEFIRLKGVILYVNDEQVQRVPDVSACYSYPIRLQKRVDAELEAGQIDQKTYQEKDSGFVYLTRYQYYALGRQQTKQTIVLTPRSSSFDERKTVIPYKGFRIDLGNRTFKTWGELINRYEGVKLERTTDGHFREDGKRADTYTFKQNYYWLLNDHQGYLNDSRSFGLVPESHVIGKAWLILFSPKTKRFLQKI